MKQPKALKATKPGPTGVKNYPLREPKPSVLTPPPTFYNGKKVTVKSNIIN